MRPRRDGHHESTPRRDGHHESTPRRDGHHESTHLLANTHESDVESQGGSNPQRNYLSRGSSPHRNYLSRGSSPHRNYLSLPNDDHDDIEASENLSEGGISEVSNIYDDPLMDLNSIKKEMSVLFRLTWPVVITNLLQFSITSISVFSLGHINTESLAAISLASLFVNTTGQCVAQGVASALDTLCSQAFTGSHDFYAIGKHLQRGIVVSFFLCIPIALMWWFSEAILLALGQEPEIAQIAGLFIKWMIPGLFPIFLNECLRKYLFAQGIMQPSMYITIFAACLSLFLQYLLVWSPVNIGAIGAPISTSIVNTIAPLATMVYIYFFKGGERFGSWSWKEACHPTKILDIIYLGVPGTFMVVSEWLCFEAAALAAGILGMDSLAAQSIVINTVTILFQIPFGLAIATTTRIGNSLGANLPHTAKRVALTALCLSALIAIVNMTLLLVFKDKLGYLFSNQESVVQLVASILPIAAVFQFSDSTGSMGGAAIRGCGLQKLGLGINLVGYYILGVPVGILLTFYWTFGLFGIWIGLAVGLFFVSTTQVIIMFQMNWKEQAQNAKKRVGAFESMH